MIVGRRSFAACRSTAGCRLPRFNTVLYAMAFTLPIRPRQLRVILSSVTLPPLSDAQGALSPSRSLGGGIIAGVRAGGRNRVSVLAGRHAVRVIRPQHRHRELALFIPGGAVCRLERPSGQGRATSRRCCRAGRATDLAALACVVIGQYVASLVPLDIIGGEAGRLLAGDFSTVVAAVLIGGCRCGPVWVGTSPTEYRAGNLDRRRPAGGVARLGARRRAPRVRSAARLPRRSRRCRRPPSAGDR